MDLLRDCISVNNSSGRSPRRWPKPFGGWSVLIATILVLTGVIPSLWENQRSSFHSSPVAKLSEVPSRVVCGSPAVAEIIFALGQGDRVVGVSDHTSHPPEAKGKRSIGDMFNPNRERLLVLEPDLIVTQGGHDSLGTFARQLGVEFLPVDLYSIEDIIASFHILGRALGASDRAQELEDELRGELAQVRKRVEGFRPRRVLFLLGRMPGEFGGLFTPGPGSFLHELIGIAGGLNIFGDTRGNYLPISVEALLMRMPDVILEVVPRCLAEINHGRLKGDWRRFPEIPAVRNERIYCLNEDFLLVPGPRIGKAASRLARAIQPEAFSE